MTENNWIIMPIEVQRREMDAKLIVATLAAQRGYKTIIGRDQMVRRMAGYLPKGILFDKSIDGVRDTKVSRYHRLGYRITAMDEEATGFLMGPDAFMVSRMADQTLSKTSRWFCINEEVHNLCIKKFPQHAEKFVVTGLGRTDTWRANFRPLFEKEVVKIKSEIGPFILFNSNFATVNHGRGDGFVKKQMKRTQKQMTSEVIALRKQLIVENTANLEAYAEVLPKMLDWFPNHKLVIRPHPAENIEYWVELFGENERVVFSKGGVVTPWILASDCMVHHGCTTGVEAELMGQAQINYAPHPDEHHDGEIPKAFSHFVYTEKELREAVTKLISGSGEYSKPRAALDRWFAGLEGKLVAERVVDEFDKIAFASDDLSKYLYFARFLPRNLVAKFKNLTKQSQVYSAQKFEGTTCEELQGKIDLIERITGQSKNAKVSQIFEDLYLIEADKTIS